MGEKERILDHLENEYSEPIRDPVWKNIYVSRGLLRIIELEQFQKLGRIKQLGPAYLVYPGATHTRLSHSLGVFHLARRMIISLVRRNAAFHPLSPGKEGLAGTAMTLEGVKGFLVAALLHDIGHYPFAHSFKDLSVEAHEVLAARQVRSDFAPAIKELGIEPEAVAAIIDQTSSYGGVQNVPFYRKLLSGVLDPDKLDYLNRDAYFCGVPYGIQDVDFILEEAYPHTASGVAIGPKGITALEDVLFAKYLMYKTVYWHKTVRIATAMIKKAIALGLASGAIRREDLYGLDDEDFFSRFTASRHSSFHLIEEVRRRALHKQVLRIPFQDESRTHEKLETVDGRLALEEEICREAGAIMNRRVPPEWVVIDLPERVSFEIAIPVLPGGEGRVAARGVLPGGAEDLPRALRSFSVLARRDDALHSALGRIGLSRYFTSP